MRIGYSLFNLWNICMQFECRDFRESILRVMPHHWVTQHSTLFSILKSERSSITVNVLLVTLLVLSYVLFLLNQDRREDTSLQLAHFKKHKRKTTKKTPGRSTTTTIHKPSEDNPLGKDPSNKIAKAIGKAADYASSSRPKKVPFCLFLNFHRCGVLYRYFHIVKISRSQTRFILFFYLFREKIGKLYPPLILRCMKQPYFLCSILQHTWNWSLLLVKNGTILAKSIVHIRMLIG